MKKQQLMDTHLSDTERFGGRALYLGVLLLFTGIALTLVVAFLPLLGPIAPVVSLISGAVTVASIDLLTAPFRNTPDRRDTTSTKQ